jgi:hypothetical protein
VILVLLLVILGGVAIGIGAYNAGVSHGLTQAGHATQIVRVVGPGFGYFPFGLILFPLFFILIFGVARAAFWGRRWRGDPGHWESPGPGQGGPAGWRKDRRSMFDEWHRAQHDAAHGDHPDPGGDPVQA